jgi:hypothetical protein
MRYMGDTSDFYEDDEPVEKIVGIFEEGEKGVTAPPCPGRTEYLHLGGLGIVGLGKQTDNDALGKLVRH